MKLGFMDSSNIERISKALANKNAAADFPGHRQKKNKEMTSSTIVTLRRGRGRTKWWSRQVS